MEGWLTRRGANRRRWRRWAAIALLPIAPVVGGWADSASAAPLYGVAVPQKLHGADLVRMHRGGIDVLRLRISWSEVQPVQGATFDWSPVDSVVVRAAAAGIEVVPYLYGSPEWVGRCSAEKSCAQRLPTGPAALSEWRRFVTAAADRYGAGGELWADAETERPVRYWQVWDQPNLSGASRQGPSPEAYGRLLDVTNRALLKADAEAQTVLGALSFSPRAARTAPADDFLSRLLALGAGKNFSAIAIEPRAGSLGGFEAQIRDVRRVLVEQDLGARHIWITTVSWASDRMSSPSMAVGLRGQEQRLRRSFQLLATRAEAWHVDGAVWGAWRDTPLDEGCRWCPHSGLLHRSGKAKPAWRAYRRIAETLQPSDPAPTPTGPTPPPIAPLPTLQTTSAFLGVAPSEIPTARDLELMEESGVGTVRLIVSWQETQSAADGQFDWSRLDAQFAGIALNGMNPLPTLLGTPDSAAELADQAAQRRWSAFVEAAVSRYRPGGPFWTFLTLVHPDLALRAPRVWQVWNEQNARAFWRPAPSPELYAQLLDLSAEAIHRSDPTAEVMLGGMFGSPVNSKSMSAVEFLTRLYGIEGARDDFDIVALHPYAADLDGVAGQFRAIRAVMAAAGDEATDTWVTEFGWSSKPDPRPEWAGYSRTPEGQAEMLTAAANLFLDQREAWRIRGVVWYTWRDPAVSTCPFCQNAGLIAQDYSAKPALQAFRDLAESPSR